ncbi:cyclic nucleotide-gated ion channel 1-like [Carya illinoinensis]|uniref:cyclic nucleotide-gated ion channel 1-like n=1 Tax=Carya illinoinensis TaxID=32201 RepID=UPI001C722896|nr:cyclic nucleotide-gated ion channel 1-like [Carya illinoinensis]
MSAQRGGRQPENPGSGQDTEGQCCFTKTSRRNVITAITRKNLNSNGKFLKIWNAILLASCVYAIAVDPLFFFVLVINEDKKCLQFHNKIYFIAIALRSVADLISLANIIFEIRTSYLDKKKAELGEIEMVGNAKRYLRTYFLVDVLAILPLPQVLFRIFIFREMRSSKYSGIRKILNALILLQYVPRALRIYGSWEKFSLTNKKLDQDQRFKCLFNLTLYTLAAQVS